MRRASDAMIRRCEHASPIMVVEVENGKVTRRLTCGESGPVHEKSEVALLAPRDREHRRRARRE